MRVCVVGATGVLGKAVLPRLSERGHHVRAVARQPEAVRKLSRLKVEAVEGNILNPSSLRTALAGMEAVLHLATSVPRPGKPPEWVWNDRIRREGTLNLIAACRENKVDRYVQQSVAHLVADGSGDLRDESAALRPSVVTQSAADMEGFVKASGLQWTILRGGALYGPGTGREEYWRSLAREGALQYPGDGTAYISPIHVVDFADAVVRSLDLATGPELLAIVDSEPVKYAELFEHIAAAEGAATPTGGAPPLWPSFRISNERARKVLNWQPRYSSYRSGFI